jgi:hypothetical protein
MPDTPAPIWPPRKAAADLTSAASRVADIVAAAEHAATELREEAERRSADRIAEADRAAEMRVQAADDEAALVREEAARYDREEHHKAATSARVLLAEARTAAREVLHDGQEITGHLCELADSLRANAERLLRDIREVHEELVSRLDRADPSNWPGSDPGQPPPPAPAPVERAPELDVPEFIPAPTGRLQR